MTQKYIDQRDESLFRSIVSYEDITTADGAGDGSTLLCSRLTTKPDFDGGTVVIASGPYKGQSRDINGVTTGGTVTPNLAFDGQITANTKFKIITVRTTPAEVAALEAKLDDGTSGLAALKALIDATEAKLDDGTTGLSALKDLIDAIEAKLDDANHGLDALMKLINAVEIKLDTQQGATGIFYEQLDVAVNINATNAAETNVLHLTAPSSRYIVRSLRLKCADPGANTVTVRLYELVNDALTEVDSFAITNANFATYHSLMDMFGLPHLAGDELKVTVRASAGGPYAVTGQYSHAHNNVAV